MNELVEIKNGTVYCDSQLVAEKFDRRHKYVVEKIKKLIEEFEEIKGGQVNPLNFIKTVGEYRNQKFEMYLMDKKAFTLLTMRFSGKKALAWQAKFIDAFFEMEKRLLQQVFNQNSLEWKQAREQGKLARRAETDIIKEFVEYATNQGSQNAKFYYKHFTVAIYKCLQLVEYKKPKLRETLDFMDLSYLTLAEARAEKEIKKGMEDKEHYKVIFELVKQNIENFAKALDLIPKQLNRLSRAR